MLPSTFSGS